MELQPTGQSAQEDSLIVPWHFLPIWKAHKAKAKGNDKNILLPTWGGLGDQICAIPTIEYALKYFKDCKITVATYFPELFAHLDLEDIYDLKVERPIEDDYLILHTIPIQGSNNIAAQFYSHMHTNCVDFPAISAFGAQLPISDREIKLVVPAPEREDLLHIIANKKDYVIVHAGRHWLTKTFPVKWWNEVLFSIREAGFVPVLIGKDDKEQGTVETDAFGCIDLRNKTTLSESIWLLQNCGVLICNDSSPLHMAVSGNAWIGFVSTVKHPDYIMHWRQGQWAWRMKSLGLGGLWEHYHICPNRTEDLDLDTWDQRVIESFLPDPKIFGQFCKEKMNDYLGKV